MKRYRDNDGGNDRFDGKRLRSMAYSTKPEFYCFIHETINNGNNEQVQHIIDNYFWTWVDDLDDTVYMTFTSILHDIVDIDRAKVDDFIKSIDPSTHSTHVVHQTLLLLESLWQNGIDIHCDLPSKTFLRDDMRPYAINALMVAPPTVFDNTKQTIVSFVTFLYEQKNFNIDHADIMALLKLLTRCPEKSPMIHLNYLWELGDVSVKTAIMEVYMAFASNDPLKQVWLQQFANIKEKAIELKDVYPNLEFSVNKWPSCISF